GLHLRLSPHDVARVGAKPSGDKYGRYNRQARLAVAERDVVIFVHRDRSHPAIRIVGVVGACLGNRRSCRRVSSVSEFIPTNGTMVGFGLEARNRNITDKRFLYGSTPKITISESVHYVGTEVIDVVSRGRR